MYVGHHALLCTLLSWGWGPNCTKSRVWLGLLMRKLRFRRGILCMRHAASWACMRRGAMRRAWLTLGCMRLQHRGQESAGIAVADGSAIVCHRAMGLLSSIFDEDVLARLTGYIAVGHTRYSTTGSSMAVNAQPLLERTNFGDIAFAHNGNLTNTEALRDALSAGNDVAGEFGFRGAVKTIALAPGDDLIAKIRRMMTVAEGAYSCTLSTEKALYAFRDPWGVRPLCYGILPGGGYIVASESCALATVGAEYVRELEPGEIIRIDDEGLHADVIAQPRPHALCMFEYIYFARPDSVLDGRAIYMARLEMGRQLAREHPVDADVVMAVPDSAIPGGIGFAQESGLPYVEGLIKNRYIGRTFISPDQKMRNLGVHLKFNPIVENLRGQRVVVVDDSIVRGTTTPRIVELVARSGRDAKCSAHHLAADHPSVLSRRRHGDVRRADRRES